MRAIVFFKSNDFHAFHICIDRSIFYLIDIRARGGVHVNNCECSGNLYKLWIAKFMGIPWLNLACVKSLERGVVQRG